jgi:Flp pilus assembly protein CpaB
VDRVANTQLVKNMTIIDGALTPKGAAGGLAPLLKEGMRGFNLQLSSLSSSVAGFLLPRDRVDVLLTTTEVGSGNPITTVLMQNIEVLAIRHHLDAPRESRIAESDAPFVTLHVTPEQAQELDLAQSRGTLKLILRNPKDNLAVTAKAVRESDIQPLVPKKPPEAPTPPGKSWDERAKDVMETWGRLNAEAAARRAADVKAAEVKAAEVKAAEVVKAKEEAAKEKKPAHTLRIFNGAQVTSTDFEKPDLDKEQKKEPGKEPKK